MKELKYITNGEIHHKPKVLFSCHPDDMKNALPLISGDILDHSNCVIWYYEEWPFENSEEMESIISDMQLLSLAITDRFLSSQNEAKDKLLPFALEKHIPVLPVMLEPGLENRFNELCAKVQLVNRYVSDPTATPYDEVLETFLDSVLVSDELSKKVRNAFDAYVFLSYRKKDRRHAKRLMHLIHENPDFRDIAIWYDEYLVPGENFNDAIKDAFDKSSLFALAVTPNLLEPGNYVKDVEYKFARNRYKKVHDGNEKKESDDRFEIVPVELYEIEKNDPRTDLKKLSEDYEDIPEVTDEHEVERTNTAFINALGRIGKKENDGDSQHNFFIGLAYLCGIDVEVNYDRALSLITSAALADEPCYDATEKLVDMYKSGEGVPVDLEKAIKWQHVLVDQYKAEYEKNYSPDEHKGFGTRYFKAMLKLSDFYRRIGKFDEAISWAQRSEDIAHSLDKEVGIRESKRDWAMAANRLGSLYSDIRDYEKAFTYHSVALEIYKQFANEIGTTRARRDLSVAYEKLGDIERIRKNNSLARENYESAYEIREKLSKQQMTPSSRRDLSAILTKLGNIQMDDKNIALAYDYYSKALEIDAVLCEELKTNHAADDYAVSLMKVAKVYKAEDKYNEAIDNYIAAKEKYDKLRKSSTLLRYQKNYAACCEKLASAYKHNKENDQAEQYYVEAIDIRKDINERTDNADTGHELAVALFNYAVFRKDKELVEKACVIWEKLSHIYPEYKRYLKKADKILELI